MEFAITIAVVAAAATWIIWGWVRSAKRALRPDRPAACGGCASCDVHAELKGQLKTPTSPPCGEQKQAKATPPGGR